MQHHHEPGALHPAVHGMLIVGETRVLLSHLPMFHVPHDYRHVITKPPDFDQITGIEITAQPADLLAGWDGSAITLNIDGAGVPPGTPLREGDQVKTSRADDPANGIAPVTVRREFYFETGDLAS